MNIKDIKCTKDRKVSEKEIKDMAESINTIGLIQPIVLNPENEVIAGRTRFLAMKLLNAHPALVHGQHFIYSKSDKEIVAFTENYMRKDLTLGEELKKLETMIKTGKDIDTVAASISKTAIWVKRRLNLKSLGKTMRNALKDEEFKKWGLAHYEFIASFTKSDQDRIMLNHEELEDLPLASFKTKITKLLGKDLARLPWETNGCGACTYCLARNDQDNLLFEELKETRKICSDVKFLNEQHIKWIEEKIGEGFALLNEDYFSRDERIIDQDGWEETKTGEKGIICRGENIGKEIIFTALKEKTTSKSLKELKELKQKQRWKFVGERIISIAKDAEEPLCNIRTLIGMTFIYDTKAATNVNGRDGILALDTISKLDDKEKAMALWGILLPEIIRDIRNTIYSKPVIESFGELFKLNIGEIWEEAIKELPDPKSWAIREKEESK